jgi:hypothetical protein
MKKDIHVRNISEQIPVIGLPTNTPGMQFGWLIQEAPQPTKEGSRLHPQSMSRHLNKRYIMTFDLPRGGHLSTTTGVEPGALEQGRLLP